MRLAGLSGWKQAVLAALVLLVIVGVYDAIRNLPVVSGCSFYANCPERPSEPPSALGRDAVS